MPQKNVKIAIGIFFTIIASAAAIKLSQSPNGPTSSAVQSAAAEKQAALRVIESDLSTQTDTSTNENVESATTTNVPEVELSGETKAISIQERRPASAINKPKGFALQIASYPDEASAQKHIDRLKQQGLPTRYTTAVINNQEWHRVNIGPFETKEEALMMRTQLISGAQIKDAVLNRIDIN